MLLFITFETSRRKSLPKQLFHLKCDNCNVEYSRTNIRSKYATSHTCSKKCKYAYHSKLTTKKSTVERTCIICSERFFVKSDSKKSICSKNCHSIAQKKNGILDLRKKKTFLERYGVESAQQIKSVQEKTRKTNNQRYGHDFGSQSTIVKEKTKQTNRIRYGVDWFTQSEIYHDKSQKTCLERYGVDHPMKSAVVKQNYDFKEIWKKAHETKKLNGSYAISKVEKRFSEKLLRIFGDVEHQVKIDHEDGSWLIDFYVKSLDTYVQFDGMYWHGLDRPIEDLRNSINHRDISIVNSFDRDRKQDKWFSSRNLKLIRITDQLVKNMTDNEIRNLLVD